MMKNRKKKRVTAAFYTRRGVRLDEWSSDVPVQRWTMPSVMAGINTKVVGRSAALAPDAPYARNAFAYNESDMCSGMGAAALGTAVVGFFGAALMVRGLGVGGWGGSRVGFLITSWTIISMVMRCPLMIITNITETPIS